MKKNVLVGLFFYWLGLFQFMQNGVVVHIMAALRAVTLMAELSVKNSTGKCTYDNDESESDGSIILKFLG